MGMTMLILNCMPLNLPLQELTSLCNEDPHLVQSSLAGGQ